MLHLFLIACLSVSQATETFTSKSDEADAKSAGVHKIQFVLGGQGEVVNGPVNEASIRDSFQKHMLEHYKCYAKNYGPDAEVTGRNVLKFRLTSTSPMYNPQNENSQPYDLQIESEGLISDGFQSCLNKVWRAVLFAIPAPGLDTTVKMPIEAKLRVSPTATPAR